MATTTAAPIYYYRDFQGKDAFEDCIADDDFVQKNFVDWFGKEWIPNNRDSFSFDTVVTPFYKDDKIFFQVFAVSDGAVVRSTQANKDWLKQSIRFVAFAAGNPNPQTAATPFDNRGSWTLCIVGSSKVEEGPAQAFLQVASWNGKSFRYYECDNPNKDEGIPPAWIFAGESSEAFGEKAYLGPFNGHVNGSLVMKELQPPWIHWLADGNNFRNMISDKILARFDKYPYLSDAAQPVSAEGFLGVRLSRVKSANLMQDYIQAGINKWTNTRKQMDLLDEKNQPKQTVQNVQRWLAHILLTTTINIGTADRDTRPGQPDGQWKFAQRHFYNIDLFGNMQAKDIQPSAEIATRVFSQSSYDIALDKHKLALVQTGPSPDVEKHPVVVEYETTNGLKEAFVVQYGEGDDIQFNILQPSYEDVQGAIVVLSNSAQKIPLLSKDCVLSLLMVDPWNPVYSWRRGVLIQYIPKTTTLSGSPLKYDLEAVFESAVRSSPRFKNELDSPEREFIANLEARRNGKADFSDRMTKYLKKVNARLSDAAQVNQAMIEYMALAESRRRIFRPLPLDEFDLTMPWATIWPKSRDPASCVEMTSEGTVQNVPPRGRAFFMNWIMSLASDSPDLMPPEDKDDTNPAFDSFEVASHESLTNRSLTVSCQSSLMYAARAAKCPALSRKRDRTKHEDTSTVPTSTVSTASIYPTWQNIIKDLFARPFWIQPAQRREIVGKGWLGAMRHYGASIPPSDPKAKQLSLDDYEQVKFQAVTIYHHCASRSMPITKDPQEYWPDEALELLRTWINQGCREKETDPIITPMPLLKSRKVPVLRIRKDVRNLTAEELLLYREKLTNVLGVMSLDSKWQFLGEMHAWWCLHYQEATFFWHRCFLHYIEELIDFPIPYWNGFALDTTDPDSPAAGIPSIFLEDTYVDRNGKSQQNPLKWAYSYQGKCKSDPSKTYCQRNPILEKGRPAQPGPEREAWNKHIGLFTTYHKQIVYAMQQSAFSLPQYDPTDHISAEAAWASLPLFTENMDDEDYKVAKGTFDGHFEQAHDNFHGWVGGKNGEMSDNTYTAFDPIFLSYHCNMDRLFEHYLRSYPNTRVTAAFPLKPFINRATDYDYTDPNAWIYTSTGEVAKSTAALGYTYAPPACPDAYQLPKLAPSVAKPSGGVGTSIINIAKAPNGMYQDNGTTVNESLEACILFEDVVCTQKSYEIDMFLKGATTQEPDPKSNPDFIGRLFRFGMGEPPEGASLRNKSRCMKESVTRLVTAEDKADAIRSRGWYQVVRELDGSLEGRIVPEEEWRTMRGFSGELVWMKV